MKASYFVTIYRKDDTAVTELYYTLPGAQARALSIVDGATRDWDIVKYGRVSDSRVDMFDARVDMFGAFYAMFGY